MKKINLIPTLSLGLLNEDIDEILRYNAEKLGFDIYEDGCIHAMANSIYSLRVTKKESEPYICYYEKRLKCYIRNYDYIEFRFSRDLRGDTRPRGRVLRVRGKNTVMMYSEAKYVKSKEWLMSMFLNGLGKGSIAKHGILGIGVKVYKPYPKSTTKYLLYERLCNRTKPDCDNFYLKGIVDSLYKSGVCLGDDGEVSFMTSSKFNMDCVHDTYEVRLYAVPLDYNFVRVGNDYDMAVNRIIGVNIKDIQSRYRVIVR